MLLEKKEQKNYGIHTVRVRARVCVCVCVLSCLSVCLSVSVSLCARSAYVPCMFVYVSRVGERWDVIVYVFLCCQREVERGVIYHGHLT